jgi:hypothetical protein
MKRPERRRRAAADRTLATVLAVLWLVLVLPVAAQQAPAAEDEPLPEEGGSEQVPDIDQILRGEEEIMGGGGYSYDPGGRRDPFRSLLASRTIERKGPRPEGIPGLLVDEVTVTGIFDTPRGMVAQVRSSDKGKSFLLKEGDQLYDGEVVSIGANEVVFKQVVQDPTALKPFHEVVKKLNP